MLACLLAAMMSSADTYMIVTSGLVVRNVYAPYINPNADEKKYVLVGRLTGLIIIVGASWVALVYSDVFGQFKMAMELPILFAAPFWIGMYWRRATRAAVWGSMLFSLLFFFVAPTLLPRIVPSLYENPSLAASTQLVTTSINRNATESDVARYEAYLTAKQTMVETDGDISLLGDPPPPAELGQPITIQNVAGGKSIYWNGSLIPVGETSLETVSRVQDKNVVVTTQRRLGEHVGSGSLNLDFVIYGTLGIDLSTASKATLETLRLPSRVLLPFAVMLGLSLITRRNSDEGLHRYFAKMNTPVLADPAADRARLETAYATTTNPRKLFQNSDWEFVKPTTKDVVGFGLSCAVCGLIIGLLMWLASIGG
jgi:SSS family solute:Na+ symporter